MLFMVILALVSLPTLSTSQLDNANLPLTYPARVINTEQVCPPYEEQVNQQVAQDIKGLLRTVAAPSCQVFQAQSSPAASLQCTFHQLSLWLLLGQELQWVCHPGLL